MKIGTIIRVSKGISVRNSEISVTINSITIAHINWINVVLLDGKPDNQDIDIVFFLIYPVLNVMNLTKNIKNVVVKIEYADQGTLIGYQTSLKRVGISLNQKDVHSNDTTKDIEKQNRVGINCFVFFIPTAFTAPLD